MVRIARMVNGQVTSFRCAGVCLAVSWNHMTMDGFAFDRFIKAWWEIADTGQTSVEPSFERSFAPSVSDKARVLGIALDMKNVGDALSKRFRNFPSSSAAQFPVVNKLINVQMASVERLRQTAREDRDAGPLQRHERLTTFECISTQIWRCFARLCRDEDDLIHLRFTVECRKKCRVPPIADDFAGNMYLFIGPPASTGREVLDKSFTRGACEIHEVVNSVTPASVASLLDNQFKSIDAMASVVNEEFPNSHSAAKSLLPVTITSWSHFDNFYKLDFGFGPPILSAPCSLFNVVNDPVVYLLPHDPNSVDAAPILLRASPTIHALLSRDPEFLDLIS
ncbi:hypothetical protein MPTK1_8g10210 [Marchantia polymorpha subsp. ruderalis]|nr:hypothetical protein MARPO_0008s0201 [Marchantia polymorpha]BBN19382.1 hypothetical protein Mp_8g10210 [Marchantia polymorpha subsp. ruderalis]|eukprot:PTQ47450.1 hypothetical protein MARPO_0008s0201 [Marchantia polymorpha]